jgi:hypothetical protein
MQPDGHQFQKDAVKEVHMTKRAKSVLAERNRLLDDLAYILDQSQSLAASMYSHAKRADGCISASTVEWITERMQAASATAAERRREENVS